VSDRALIARVDKLSTRRTERTRFAVSPEPDRGLPRTRASLFSFGPAGAVWERTADSRYRRDLRSGASVVSPKAVFGVPDVRADRTFPAERKRNRRFSALSAATFSFGAVERTILIYE